MPKTKREVINVELEGGYSAKEGEGVELVGVGSGCNSASGILTEGFIHLLSLPGWQSVQPKLCFQI